MDNIMKIIATLDASKLKQGITQATSNIDKFSNRLKSTGSKLTKNLSLPLSIAGGAAIKMATDFNESLNKVDVAFGNSSKEVKDFAKTTLESFGIAEGSALDMAAMFGDMSTSMGLSTEQASSLSTSLVGLAGDLASFKNIQIGQATTALAGVFTGETESLKRLGIVMTQANLQQFAYNQGINKQIQDMSQAEKVLLRYNYVMSVTKNSQGDFARTQEGAANQMRIFSEGLKQLGSSFGQILLPAFTRIVKMANSLTKSFIGLSGPTKKIVVILALIGASAGPMLYLAGTVLPKMVAGFTLLNGAVLANPVIAITAAVTALTAAFIEFLHQINPAVTRIQTFFNFLKSGGDVTRFAQLQMKTMAANTKNQSDVQIEANKNTEAGTKLYADMTKELEAIIANAGGDGAAGSIDSLSNSIEDLNVSLEDIIGKSSIVAEDLKQLRAFNPNDVEVLDEEIVPDAMLQKLLDKSKRIKDALKDLNSQASQIISDGLANMAAGLGEALGDAITGTGNAVQSLGRTLLGGIGAMAQQLGMMAIKIGIGIEAIKTAFKTLAGPIAIAAGIALIALGQIFKTGAAKIGQSAGGNVPAFANGGIVSGPTLGLIGEYSGARSNPEVVAPLDKLRGMIGQQSQNINVGGEFRIQGQDLIVALQRAEKGRNRLI